MDDPTNLMMITGVFLFDAPLTEERLRGIIESKLLAHRRFRQRVVPPARPWQRAQWADDPHFDLDSHLLHIALPAPGDQAALEHLVNQLMSAPLDDARPLWQFHLLDNFNGGSALVCRLHHAIGDGIALVRLLLALTDELSEPAPGVTPAGPLDLKGSPRTRGRRRLDDLVIYGLELLVDTARIRDAGRLLGDASQALARLLALPPDARTPLKGPLGVAKRCVWTQPVPLADVKAIGRVCGGTVNDVLLSMVSGALGRYLRTRGVPIAGLNFRAVVPVNLRPPDEQPSMGNSFGLVFVSLPVGIEEPRERLLEMKVRMDALKATPEAMVAFGILAFIGVATRQVEQLVVRVFGLKATAVITNVRGPDEIRYLAGQPIRGLMFWVPQSGRLGLGVSILSYNNEVLVGVATDAGLVPDPQTIIEAFSAELDEYQALVRMAREAEVSAV
jgi:WS/DGAT/MGAT family acyltransferase